LAARRALESVRLFAATKKGGEMMMLMISRYHDMSYLREVLDITVNASFTE
jgi:hypothetical protein